MDGMDVNSPLIDKSQKFPGRKEEIVRLPMLDLLVGGIMITSLLP